MLNVTILSTEVRKMVGVSKTTGKPYDMTFQTAYFFLADKSGKECSFPERVEIVCPKDQSGNVVPFVPGKYILHPSSIFVSRDGHLACQPRLIPASQTSRASA